MYNATHISIDSVRAINFQKVHNFATSKTKKKSPQLQQRLNGTTVLHHTSDCTCVLVFESFYEPGVSKVQLATGARMRRGVPQGERRDALLRPQGGAGDRGEGRWVQGRVQGRARVPAALEPQGHRKRTIRHLSTALSTKMSHGNS